MTHFADTDASYPVRILHIGLPKSASTSVQYQVFWQHPEIEVHVKHGPDKGDETLAGPLLTNAKSYGGRQADDDKRVSVLTALDTLWSGIFENTCKAVVVSDEAIVRTIDASSLHHALCGCQLMVIIRNPFSYYQSAYHQYLKGMGVKLNKPLSPDEWLRDFFDRAGNDYERLVEYIRVWGAQNVCLLPFEWLETKQELFASELASLCHVDAVEVAKLLNQKRMNKRVSNRSLIAARLRRTAPWLYSILVSSRLVGIRHFSRKIFAEKPAKFEFSDEGRKLIYNMTVAPCSEIEVLQKRGLAGLGYPTQEADQ